MPTRARSCFPKGELRASLGIQPCSASQSDCPGLMLWRGRPALVCKLPFTRLDSWIDCSAISPSALLWAKCCSNLAGFWPRRWGTRTFHLIPRGAWSHTLTALCRNIFNNTLTRTNFSGQNICWFPTPVIYSLLCALYTSQTEGKGMRRKRKKCGWRIGKEEFVVRRRDGGKWEWLAGSEGSVSHTCFHLVS